MPLHEPIATRQAGARQLRSYRDELSKWSRKTTRQYAIAIVALSLGLLFVITAAGFGVAAGFHYLALRYGINIAAAMHGGAFLVSL
jgi:hypothetical protein